MIDIENKLLHCNLYNSSPPTTVGKSLPLSPITAEKLVHLSKPRTYSSYPCKPRTAATPEHIQQTTLPRRAQFPVQWGETVPWDGNAQDCLVWVLLNDKVHSWIQAAAAVELAYIKDISREHYQKEKKRYYVKTQGLH